MNTIQDYTVERGIGALLHFTREDNLASILERGLLCRDVLEREGQSRFNDQYRLDRTKAICLSIQAPNYKMFYPLRQANLEENWVVIGVNPEVLWMLSCAFCSSNAASNAVTAIPLQERMGLPAFMAMYDDWGDNTRDTLGLAPAYPTNPQAEVLVLERIAPQHILGVATNGALAQQRIQQIHPGINVIVSSTYFTPRADYAHWQNS